MSEIIKKEKLHLPVAISAPCRLDYGGTLDISTFYLPLRSCNPSTFNLAFDMRTTVTLWPYDTGRIKITSAGFEPIEYPTGHLSFNHPMGLMSAIAAFFNAESVHIDIKSASPPRSALGGSSVAAVALIGAFFMAGGRQDLPPDEIVMLAQQIESSVARVPCGIQDQLAAAYGGISQWYWTGSGSGLPYMRKIIAPAEAYPEIEKSLIAAYCGQPHESKDINGRWVDSFLKGKSTDTWKRIAGLSENFSETFAAGDFKKAGRLMQEETDLRISLTPDVLDETGHILNRAAAAHDCGLRFTGAGGGGCVWAVGPAEKITTLKTIWENILKNTETGHLLDIRIDGRGLKEAAI